MQRTWLLLIYAILLLFLMGTGVEAFSTSWTWTPVQIRFAFLMVSIVFGGLYRVVIRMRGGNAAVQAQSSARQDGMSRPFDAKLFRRSLAVWIIAAVALVILFAATRT